MTRGAPPRSLEVLLAGIVDYAGLFPPAALAMPAAVREYRDHRTGPYAWALGRFVVPAARLEELERALAEEAPASRGWRLSALVGPEHVRDAEAVRAFNARAEGRAVIDVVETKAATVGELEAALAPLRGLGTVYVEVPLEDDLESLLAELARRGVRAKVRTGGVTAGAFPSPERLVRFLAACVALDLPFKATAGLHHPVRGEYRLTYEPASPCGTMYGFLNDFVAAAALRRGAPAADAAAILEERNAAAFRFDDGGISWRERIRLETDELARTRDTTATSFGSCSFREPIDDLRALRLL